MRLATEEGFERGENYFSLQGKGWHFIFQSADRVEPEDIPASVFRELPGIGYFIHAYIEGAAPVSAREQAIRLAKKIARNSRGVLVNPQDDTVEMARGVKRVDLAGLPKEESTLHLSWWFEDATSFENGGYIRFVEALESHAPEILPRRYGAYEPPQFKLAEHGREHFLSFLHKSLRTSLVWYANHPFAFVFVSIPPKVGGSRRGFRCCRLEVQVQARILQSPGWPLALKRLWLAVAQAVSPFFAEIREGNSPVKSWWWNGIPRTFGVAALIGAPYDKMWPEFIAISKHAPPNFFYMETIGERKNLSINPPAEIMQPDRPETPKTFTAAELKAYTAAAIKYPEAWPFSEPFTEV